MKVRAAGLFCLCFALLSPLGAAAAQSLKALRAQEAEENDLAREVAYTNSVCGSGMDSSIDWRASQGWPDGESLASACDGALGALEAVCRSRAGKARLQSLTHFVCAGDGAGPSLSGSTFRFGASPGGGSFSEALGYLENLD